MLQCRSSRAGKSVRKWLPRLSVRLSAAVAMSHPTVAMLLRGLAQGRMGVVEPRSWRNVPAARERQTRVGGLRALRSRPTAATSNRGSRPTSASPHLRAAEVRARRRPRGRQASRAAASQQPLGRRTPALRAANCSRAGWRHERRCRRLRAANNCAIDVRPSRSVSTPPIR